MLLFSILFLIVQPAHADSPIYQGLLWDTTPAAAYNAKRGEFLVVWTVFNPLFPPNDVRFFGPVMGQLIRENGSMVGDAFEIMAAGGVVPQVAYHERNNEYLVVAESNYQTVGQRVSAIGQKIGGLTTYLSYARAPRVLYNTLAGNYMVAGAWWSDAPTCTIVIGTVQVSASGQPMGAPTMVANEGYGYCGDNTGIYDVAYAPISSNRAPWGRYLLAIGHPANLKMLDSSGRVMPVLYDFAHSQWIDDKVPFQSGVTGTPYDFRMAFGYVGGQPVFFLAWADSNHYIQVFGQTKQWTGIWGGLVKADQELYDSTAVVKNEVFPVSSYQWDHNVFPDYYKQWKPMVHYSSSAGTFVVVWRETPKEGTGDLTSVNHIRVNTSSGYRIPPLDNLVVSATGGTENPSLPVLAASSRSGAVLMAWEDHRGFLGIGDIYGTMFDAGTRTTSGINPGPPGEAPVYWKSIAAGNFHTLGIQSDESLWAWGDNYNGQLGLGNQNDQDLPQPVDPGTAWSLVAAGVGHAHGIKVDGSLWSWGTNYTGQLGIGEQFPDQNIPKPVDVGSAWTQISAGDQHTVGIKMNGGLWAWGWNGNGQLGIGSQTVQFIPVPVDPGSIWFRVSAGGYHTVGIKADRSLWAWGHNGKGQVGIGKSIDPEIPMPVEPGSMWNNVATGMFHTLGIKLDGSLWAWGLNDRGQLGIGEPLANQFNPVPVAPGSTWVQIAAGHYHTIGIKTDGSLWSWGENSLGQLGLGDIQDRYEPTRIGTFSDWVMVSAGLYHSLGLRANGCLYSWGNSGFGQLGLGDTRDRHEPTLIPSSCPDLSDTKQLTVTPSGSGSGTVTGNGIDCAWNGSAASGTCSVSLAKNTVVILSASAMGGSTFDGWQNGNGSAAGCSGTGNLVFTINAASEVEAYFVLGGPNQLRSIYMPLILR
jgi:alpha-tubulin suppressor-like RCC1 family protein